MPAKVIRTNKYRDLALIKVEGKFEKVFAVNNTKAFKKMQDVYTIGTPKSIELGQSISAGLISNERKTETTNLLQLGMSVNGGNSGGPLFDATGALHGVIVSKLIGSNTEGVSFAIPAYLIQEYLNINFN
jgi:serine protease Do